MYILHKRLNTGAMKILMAIQGTGNGHLSRARDIIPELMKYGSVDILLSGHQVDVELPYSVKYRLDGLYFVFGKHGGIDLWQTIRNMNISRFTREVLHLPLQEYDLIVNDFEPVSAWAAFIRQVPCISLSHQAAVIHESAPRPDTKSWLGKLILKYYAPCSHYYGFHFEPYDRHIFPPVIRKEVRDLKVTHGAHYTVYLPAYDDVTLARFLGRFPGVEWHVFSKHSKDSFCFENIHFHTIANGAFLDSLASCSGALLGAGFEAPAEALYMGKKIMVIPMKGQYEQQCNAEALSRLGIPVIPALSSKYYSCVEEWVNAAADVDFTFPPDTARAAVQKLMEDFVHEKAQAAMLAPGLY